MAELAGPEGSGGRSSNPMWLRCSCARVRHRGSPRNQEQQGGFSAGYPLGQRSRPARTRPCRRTERCPATWGRHPPPPPPHCRAGRRMREPRPAAAGAVARKAARAGVGGPFRRDVTTRRGWRRRHFELAEGRRRRLLNRAPRPPRKPARKERGFEYGSE